MVIRKIVWDILAKDSLKSMVAYTKKDSPQNAEIVKTKVLSSIKELSKHPEKHKPDQYKKENNNQYRAFEIYHIRIAYYIEPEAIRIIRIRSTHQEPLDY